MLRWRFVVRMLLAFATAVASTAAGATPWDSCYLPQGCLVDIVIDPATNALGPTGGELPLLIPGDVLSVQIEGDTSRTFTIASWHCSWEEDARCCCNWLGMEYDCKRHYDQDTTETGSLGKQIVLSVQQAKDVLGALTSSNPRIGPVVITKRGVLGAVGSVAGSKPPRGSGCTRTASPAGGTWYQVRVVIKRANKY